MGQKLYSQGETGIRFTSYRKGEVRIPNYVYDLWMPLLGAVGMGVYAMYCRLEREDVVKAMTQARIAKLCRIGTRKLDDINEMLEDCGLIVITKPEGHKRLMHWTTEIEVFDAPQTVSQELIDEYAPSSGYECMSPWLVTEMLPNISEDVTQQLDEKLGDNANVVSLGLDTLDVVAPSGVASIEDRPSKSSVALDITITDEGYQCEPCPWCEASIILANLRKASAACPACGTPLWVRDAHGKEVMRPAQQYRSGAVKRVIGDIVPGCPDKLADIMYYARDKQVVDLLIGRNRDMFLDCLNWAVGKMAVGDMPPNKVTERAIAWMQKRLKAGEQPTAAPKKVRDLPKSAVTFSSPS